MIKYIPLLFLLGCTDLEQNHTDKCGQATRALEQFEMCKVSMYNGDCYYTVERMQRVAAAEKYLELCE